MHKYYSLDEIRKIKARYYVIFGERSNGKTSAVLELILKRYCESGGQEQGAIIRRWDEDLRGSKGQQVWSSIADERGLVAKYTNGEWDRVVYNSRQWVLARWDEELQKLVKDNQPFCFAFALSQTEHFKSTAYPFITTILFDEFISPVTAGGYLVDEWMLFQHTLSTIIRQRDNVEIYMCGNTISKYNPYFQEMRLKNASKQKAGTIDTYEIKNGKSVNVIACERTAHNEKDSKKSDVYFNFDDTGSHMITEGDWQLGSYPHCPMKIDPKNIIYKIFIDFNDDLLQGDVVIQDKCLFMYFHRKTTEMKDDKYPYYKLEFDPRRNHYINPTIGYDKCTQRISSIFKAQKVFFQNNDVGDEVMNYVNQANAYTYMNL